MHNYLPMTADPLPNARTIMLLLIVGVSIEVPVFTFTVPQIGDEKIPSTIVLYGSSKVPDSVPT